MNPPATPRNVDEGRARARRTAAWLAAFAAAVFVGFLAFSAMTR